MRLPHPFFVFVASVAMIWWSDSKLIDMLGQHPMQSELTFLDQQVRDVEMMQKEQAAKKQPGQKAALKNAQMPVKPAASAKPAPKKKISVVEWVLMGVAGFILLSLLTLIILVVIHQRKNASAGVPDVEPWTARKLILSFRPGHALVILGLILSLEGVHLYLQGTQGAAKMEEEVNKVEERERMQLVEARSEFERRHDHDIVDDFNSDLGRAERGRFTAFMGLGFLLIGAMLLYLQWRRSRRRVRRKPALRPAEAGGVQPLQAH